MLNSDLLAHRTLSVAVVPARAAYLIASRSSEGFRRAVQEACTRWGGATEPILQVAPSGRLSPWDSQVLELSHADGLVNVDVAADAAERVARRSGKPLVQLVDIDRSGITAFTAHPAAIARDTLPAYKMARDSAALWEVAAVGDISGEARSNYEQAGVPVIGVTEDFAARGQLAPGTLIDLTTASFGESASTGGWAGAPALVFVTRRNSLAGCLWFWNIRALRTFGANGTLMLLLPDRGVEHWLGVPEGFRSLLAQPTKAVPDVVISGPVAEATKHRIANLLGLVETHATVSGGRGYPPPPVRTAPFSYRCDVDARTFVVHEREYGAVIDAHVIATLGSPIPVRFENPVPFRLGGLALVRFRGDFLDELPHRAETARLINTNAVWQRQALQLATRLRSQYDFEFRLPTPTEVVRALADAAVGTFKLSDKGLLGIALQDRCDLREIDVPICLVIGAMTTPRADALVRALRRAGVSDAELVNADLSAGIRAERRYIDPSVAKNVTTDGPQVLEKLCDMGWAERGLVYDCANCGIRSFVPLAHVEGRPRCPACNTAGRYSATKHTPVINYRLDALVDRASDQGVLPHLLTMAALVREDPGACVLPGIVITPEGHPREVDLFGVFRGKVIAGEVKSSGAEFTKSQIERDVTVSRLLRADLHVIAAQDGLPDQAVSVASARTKRAGLRLLVVRGSDVSELMTPASRQPNDGARRSPIAT